MKLMAFADLEFKEIKRKSGLLVNFRGQSALGLTSFDFLGELNYFNFIVKMLVACVFLRHVDEGL